MNYVKFKTNVREQVTFKFDTGLEREGQFGKQFNYGVEWNGEEAYMSVTPILNDQLQKLSPLKGRTLEIEKVEGEGGKKHWVIYEGGKIITPNQELKPATQNTNLEQVVKILVKEVKELKQRVDRLESPAIEINDDGDKVEIDEVPF